MTSKEDFGKLVDSLKEGLDETAVALVSENLLSILSTYNTIFDKLEEVNVEKAKLLEEKEELLKVNGKLYQRIGFDEVKEEVIENKVDDIEELSIEDVIDEKGEII